MNEQAERTRAIAETLVGLSADDATTIAHASGEYELRTISPGQPVTADFRANRITLEVADGVVIRASAG